MNTRTPEVSTAAQLLYDLHEELDRFSSKPVLEGNLEHYQAVYSASPAVSNIGLYELIYHAMMGANNVIRDYQAIQATPEHMLAINAVRAAQNGTTPKFHEHYQDLCLAAELKVEHSIELNQTGRGPHHGAKAAVLFDVDGKPFAYSKSVGEPVALAWREAVMDTSLGFTVIPAGAFFSFNYRKQEGADKKDSMDGAGEYLISLEYAAPPTDVRLYRFSAFLLDRQLAECAYKNATSPEAYDYLKYLVPSVLDLGLDGIAEQVQALLREGHASSVWKPQLTA